MATIDFIPTNQLLDLPVGSHGLSPAFRQFAASRGLHTLREMLHHPLDELLAMPGFSTGCYEELIGLLERHRRLYLLTIANPI